MSGTVFIPNVGEGDLKISFDKSNPVERIRAARIVTDMLRRGYALLVEVEENGEKVFRRALDFDSETCEYIIADFDPQMSHLRDNSLPPYIPARIGAGAAGHEETETPQEPLSAPQEPPARRGRGRKGRVSAETTRAVGIARSAGG